MVRKFRLKARTVYPYVQSVTDGTGKVRHYFRRAGSARIALPGAPGSPEFLEAYRQVLPVRFRPGKRAGNVYFFRMGDFVKIGFSGDWEARLGTIATSAPLPVSVLLTMKGTKQTERELHFRFKEHRTQREWFRYGPEIEAYVESKRAKLDPKLFTSKHNCLEFLECV